MLGERPVTDVAAREVRLRFGRRDRQGRRRHDRAAVRRRADRQGRSARRGVRHDRRGHWPPSGSPAPSSGSSRSSTWCRRGWPGSPTSSCGSSAGCSSSVRNWPPTRTPGIACRTARREVSAEMVEGIDTLLRDLEAHVGARVHRPGRVAHERRARVTRTILRGERRAVALSRDGLNFRHPICLPYLNRLADLLWVLARAVEQAESGRAPPSRPGRRRGRIGRRKTRNTMSPNRTPWSRTRDPLTPNQSLRHAVDAVEPRRPAGRPALGGVPHPGVCLDVRRAAADCRRCGSRVQGNRRLLDFAGEWTL